MKKNNPDIRPGDPYAFEGKENPFKEFLKDWSKPRTNTAPRDQTAFDAGFRAGTTSIQAADNKGWAVSVTPSGGWMPAFIAGETLATSVSVEPIGSLPPTAELDGEPVHVTVVRS